LELDSRMLRAYQRMAADLRRVFGDRFVALVAGRAGAAAVFVREIRTDDLEAMGAIVGTWHHEGLATPLLMTPGEFERSLDTFPGEYQDLIDQHMVIDGVSPLAGARVAPDDLRRACEAQARGHLIHLRQGWIDESGHAHGLAHLIDRSAAPLRRVLTNLARLSGETLDGDAGLATFAERRAGLSSSLITAILALERAQGATRAAASQALVPRLGEYLAASERLWSYIDAWRPHGSGSIE
jgi:hypothetical protein